MSTKKEEEKNVIITNITFYQFETRINVDMYFWIIVTTPSQNISTTALLQAQKEAK